MARKPEWWPSRDALRVLTKLCPNAVTPQVYGMARFVEDEQAHLIVVDRDSYLAAQVTLTLYGGDVSALGWADENHYHLAFFNEERGAEAILFYNRLPKRMASYKGRGAEHMKLPPRAE